MTGTAVDPGLIFDVGCHRGDDTAYYLAKGFRVVAVEANRELYEATRARLAGAVGSGQLVVLNCCVSDTSGTVDFFVNENDGWSSFVEATGTRGGSYRRVPMETVPLDDLLLRFGVPHFMKIDVEGAEDRLLRALGRVTPRPTVLALEVDFFVDDPVVELVALGYRAFAFVRQPHLEPDPELPGWEFTRCSSGPLHRGLLEGACDAGEASRRFAEICAQPYRWHDLYAADTTSELWPDWPHTPGADHPR